MQSRLAHKRLPNASPSLWRQRTWSQVWIRKAAPSSLIRPCIQHCRTWDSLDSVNQNHLKQAGFGFGYCQVFTGRVLASVDLGTEQGRDQHFQAFDLANQALKATEQAFAAMLKEYRVLVS